MKTGLIQRITMQEKFRSILGPAIVAGIGGALLYSYLHTSEAGFFPGLSQVSGFLISAITGAATGIIIYYVNRFLNQSISWQQNYAVRFLAGFVAYAVLSFGIFSGIGKLLTGTQQASLLWKGFNINDDDLIWKLGILLLVASFIYAVVYALLYSHKHYAVVQIGVLQQERKQLELQFEALKSQLSPHYLFNSLNTISSLIYNDRQTAEQFIRRLAQTYQYVLSTQNKRSVTLQEELEFVKSYFYLLRIRFQHLLNVEINIPNNLLLSSIPPLTIQLLVENAVKHNPATAEHPLYIYISAIDNTQLKIVNTKTVAGKTNIPSTRIGLDNIKQRYRYFTSKPVQVKDDAQYTVLLPVIHQQLNKAS
jgi:two-component system LytT family sensor kinase